MFILASQSPRRRELLSMLGLDFQIVTADIDETMNPSLSIEDAVADVCRRKAEAVAVSHPDKLIVSADTIVVVDEMILGKPHDAEDAKAMLRRLSGRTHTVMTAFCLLQKGVAETHVEKTHVRFKALSEEEISAYVATGAPLDKAGAYGIQGQAALFVEALDGDYFNVVGLPLCALGKALRKAGVEILGSTKE